MTGAADFGGYATRYNTRCTDGRTITEGAFEHLDGAEVPMVFQHNHDDLENVLGFVRLEHRPGDGMYCHGFFNDTSKGETAKKQVKHGDLRFLSIFANGLVEKSKQVMHGVIREVSLVLAGANPGAVIDNVVVMHSDGEMETFSDEAIITSGDSLELAHADSGNAVAEKTGEERTAQDVWNTLNEEQVELFDFMLSQALSVEGDLQHSDSDDENADADGDGDGDSNEADEAAADDESTNDEESTEENEASAEADESSEGSESEEGSEADEAEGTGDTDGSDSAEADEVSEAGDSENTDENEAGDDAVQHDNIQEDTSMTHNLFDKSGKGGAELKHTATLEGDKVKSLMHAADSRGSLKKVFREFAVEEGITVDGELKHGIENIEYLFPDAKLLDTSPNYLSRRMEWVATVLDGVRRTPFARIKTITADITVDEARAKGYIKGNEKVEEFFKLIRRTTTPQTIYKKQKLDRDDVLDITDLDVIMWVKAEMKVMLDEEIAGAILIGDGRSNGDDDKIDPDNVRPIAFDDELYTTTVNVNLADSNSSGEELVDAAIANRRYWKGTGMPSYFTSETNVAKILTAKDSFGHRRYPTLGEAATAMRVKEIVPVEVLDREPTIAGIMVNLQDYAIGTDRGGQATMFDDFDLDFNKYIYLLETRLCGALTLPKSAIVFKAMGSGDAEIPEPLAPTRVGNVITVPTVTSVTYKDGANVTLTTGSPVELEEGDVLDVKAFAAANKYFPTNANDQWHYEYDPDA